MTGAIQPVLLKAGDETLTVPAGQSEAGLDQAGPGGAAILRPPQPPAIF